MREFFKGMINYDDNQIGGQGSGVTETKSEGEDSSDKLSLLELTLAASKRIAATRNPIIISLDTDGTLTELKEVTEKGLENLVVVKKQQ